ncbi:MAG: class I SAM-dependent methyltransferase [Thermodesulfobacteriota bacterium]
MSNPEQNWKTVAAAFQDQADEYENWFADNPVFASELSALLAIETELAEPRLEIGVGPGLFATRLGISFGIDPAFAPLVKAKDNAIQVCRAIGEQLPFAGHQFGTVFLLFTLCFLQDPARVFKECRRVLSSSGHLALGIIPGNSSWGKELADKGRKGHPLYRHARFHEKEPIETALINCGFEVRETISTLRQSPAKTRQPEEPHKGYDQQAGLLVLVANKRPTG